MMVFMSLVVSGQRSVCMMATISLKGLSSENDIQGYFIEKSVLISKIWLKVS